MVVIPLLAIPTLANLEKTQGYAQPEEVTQSFPLQHSPQSSDMGSEDRPAAPRPPPRWKSTRISETPILSKKSRAFCACPTFSFVSIIPAPMHTPSACILLTPPSVR